MTTQEIKTRLEQLARNNESCNTCIYQSKRTCRYSNEEHKKPVVAGMTVCTDHTKKVCPHFDNNAKKCKLCTPTQWDNFKSLGDVANQMCTKPSEFPDCAVPKIFNN
jgi:hypothetical protein